MLSSISRPLQTDLTQSDHSPPEVSFQATLISSQLPVPPGEKVGFCAKLNEKDR